MSAAMPRNQTVEEPEPVNSYLGAPPALLLYCPSCHDSSPYRFVALAGMRRQLARFARIGVKGSQHDGQRWYAWVTQSKYYQGIQAKATNVFQVTDLSYCTCPVIC